jgi:hypothetical protein
VELRDDNSALVHLPDFDHDATTKIPAQITAKLHARELKGSTLSVTPHSTHLAHRPKHRPADWSLPANLDAGVDGEDGGKVVLDGVEVTVPRLIIRNLHFSTGEKHLRSLFSPLGLTPVSVTLSVNARGKPSGFGFATFKTMEEAKRALKEGNGGSVLGRQVAVDWSLPKDVWERAKETKQEDEDESSEEEVEVEKEGSGSDEESGSGSGSDSEEEVEEDEEAKEKRKKEATDTDDGTTLFVRNLAFETTEDEVREKWAFFPPLATTFRFIDKLDLCSDSRNSAASATPASSSTPRPKNPAEPHSSASSTRPLQQPASPASQPAPLLPATSR